MKKYVILGGSIAGLTAARAIRSIDKDGEITIISAEEFLPYSKVLLTHYIAGHVKEENLYITDEQELRHLNVNIVLDTMANDIDMDNNEVILDNGVKLKFDALLLATGGNPVIPKDRIQIGCAATGLRTLKEARRIKQTANNKGNIIITGGGLVGIKLICALYEAGCTGEMVIKSNYILSKIADEEAALRIMNHLRSKGLSIRTGIDIKKIEANEDKITVLLDNGQQKEYAMAVYCKGVRPCTDFINCADSKKEVLKVNEYMMTQMPGVYAAGDVASTYEITTNSFKNVAIWPHAVEQGKIAGLNMAGEKIRYRGSLSRNALEILGLPFIAIGTTNFSGNREDFDCDVKATKDSYKKFIYKKGKLVGVILLGDVLEAGKLQAMIRENNNYLCE